MILHISSKEICHCKYSWNRILHTYAS